MAARVALQNPNELYTEPQPTDCQCLAHGAQGAFDFPLDFELGL